MITPSWHFLSLLFSTEVTAVFAWSNSLLTFQFLGCFSAFSVRFLGEKFGQNTLNTAYESQHVEPLLSVINCIEFRRYHSCKAPFQSCWVLDFDWTIAALQSQHCGWDHCPASWSKFSKALAVGQMGSTSHSIREEFVVDSATARCPDHHPSTTIMTVRCLVSSKRAAVHYRQTSPLWSPNVLLFNCKNRSLQPCILLLASVSCVVCFMFVCGSDHAL